MKGAREVSGERGSVYFSVYAPEAEGVLLVLMKTLAPTPVTYEAKAAPGPDGVWTAELDLVPGEYRYFFIVDGRVTVDAGSGRVVQDDFGGLTGVLDVRRTPEGDLRIF